MRISLISMLHAQFPCMKASRSNHFARAHILIGESKFLGCSFGNSYFCPIYAGRDLFCGSLFSLLSRAHDPSSREVRNVEIWRRREWTIQNRGNYRLQENGIPEPHLSTFVEPWMRGDIDVGVTGSRASTIMGGYRRWSMGERGEILIRPPPCKG